MNKPRLTVDEAYDRAINAMTPAQRVQRGVELMYLGREIIKQRLRNEHGPMSEERLKCLLALELYGDDPQIRGWIEQAMSRAPD
jgi:hypothetical protein